MFLFCLNIYLTKRLSKKWPIDFLSTNQFIDCFSSSSPTNMSNIRYPIVLERANGQISKQSLVPHEANVSLTKVEAASCSQWWITRLEKVSNLCKLILIAHWNEWKIMSVWKMGNQSAPYGLLWKIASNANYTWFVSNGTEDTELPLWSFKGLYDDMVCAGAAAVILAPMLNIFQCACSEAWQVQRRCKQPIILESSPGLARDG